MHELGLIGSNRTAKAVSPMPPRPKTIVKSQSLPFTLDWNMVYMVDQMFYFPDVATEEWGVATNSNTEEQSNRISSASWKL